MDAPLVHHVTLTVGDLGRSAQFYRRLFGPAREVTREGPGWHRLRLQWPSGLILGLTVFDRTGDDRFDPARPGLDHIGFGCTTREQFDAWVARMDDLGIAHGPVEDTPYALVVTGRDPDGLPVEFFWPKVT